METYANLSGKSSVRSYEIEANAIIVQFNSGRSYRYTNDSAGAENIEIMRNLARRGAGLGSFINREVRDRYDDKF